MFDEVTAAVARRPVVEYSTPHAQGLLDRRIADGVHAGRDAESLGRLEVFEQSVIVETQHAGSATAVGRRHRRRAAADRSIQEDVAADVRQTEGTRQFRIGLANFRMHVGRQRAHRGYFGRIVVAGEPHELRVQMRHAARERQIDRATLGRSPYFERHAFREPRLRAPIRVSREAAGWKAIFAALDTFDTARQLEPLQRACVDDARMRVDTRQHRDATGMKALERGRIGRAAGPQRVVVASAHDDATVDRKSFDRSVQSVIGTYERKVARTAQVAGSGEMNVTIGQGRYDDRSTGVDAERADPGRFFSNRDDAMLVDEDGIAAREAARRSIE
jgi:hypothetical protein